MRPTARDDTWLGQAVSFLENYQGLLVNSLLDTGLVAGIRNWLGNQLSRVKEQFDACDRQS